MADLLDEDTDAFGSFNDTLQKINEFCAKPLSLGHLHDRMMKLSSREGADTVEEVRVTMIQKDVVNQFKRLREARIRREVNIFFLQCFFLNM